MANNNGYPNGWKDGWSSADHADKSYSPYAEESSRQEALRSSEERDRKRTANEEALRKQKENWENANYERERIEKYEEDTFRSRSREIAEARRAAINLIVEQKRAAYKNKSWFGRVIATISGKSFDKKEAEIREAAEVRVDAMNPSQLQKFVDNGGRFR